MANQGKVSRIAYNLILKNKLMNSKFIYFGFLIKAANVPIVGGKLLNPPL